MVHGKLVEIGEHSVVLEFNFAIIPNRNSSLIVTKDFVLLNLWETWTSANDPASLILMNFIIRDIVTTIKHDNPIAVIVDIIMLDPTEPSLNTENALWPWLIDQVI